MAKLGVGTKFNFHAVLMWRPCRIKEKLGSGQFQVARDQWPIFLYANYTYDSNDPWNGLLHSGLLVSVCFTAFNEYNDLTFFRLISTSLHRPAW
jgi:hypothetical protein